MKRENKHGGRRQGAGRPPIYGERVKWLILLPVDLAARVERRREKVGLSQSAAVELALEEWLTKR